MARHRKILEKDIEKQILNWANMYPNVFCWKANTTGIYDPSENVWRSLKGFAIKGISDILGIISPRGQAFAMECKTPERKALLLRRTGIPCTPEQLYFIERIKAYGGIAGVVTSLEVARILFSGVL